ncbi:MAG: hypothetical protein A2150_02900 [Candidatus Muproteobacteria bacterium RBG_16_64_11]|uniref:Uncharacterized protein n=1 Tax=Candidatus Muproteobacteria bacterium RBG_16_64_11 TaxID=1817758 RepID=A0A1F6TCT1_9PROT|nr:MAG: hypothetical protein A2150_02900 [Candidatus Muproteobacteria bacterium RBG_16_64_11]
MDAPYAGKLDVVRPCTDLRLGCDEIEGALEFLVECIWRLWAVCPPPGSGLGNLTVRAADDPDG